MNVKNAAIIIIAILLAIVFAVPALVSALYTGIGRKNDGTTDTAPLYGPEEQNPILEGLNGLSEYIRGIPSKVKGFSTSDTVPGGDGTVNQGGNSSGGTAGGPDHIDNRAASNDKPVGSRVKQKFTEVFNKGSTIKNDPYTTLGLVPNLLNPSAAATFLAQRPTKVRAVAGASSRGGLIGPRRSSTNTANKPYNPRVNVDTFVGPVQRVSNSVKKKLPSLGGRRPGSRKR